MEYTGASMEYRKDFMKIRADSMEY